MLAFQVPGEEEKKKTRTFPFSISPSATEERGEGRENEIPLEKQPSPGKRAGRGVCGRFGRIHGFSLEITGQIKI